MTQPAQHQDTTDQAVLDKTTRKTEKFSNQAPRVTNGGANEAHEATLQGNNKQPSRKKEKNYINDQKTELLRAQ